MKGLFRQLIPTKVEEQHGGGLHAFELWKFFCFYSDGRVGYYIDSKDSIEPIFNFDTLIYKGKVESFEDKSLIFSVQNSHNQNVNFYRAASTERQAELEICRIDQLKKEELESPKVFREVEIDLNLISRTKGHMIGPDKFLFNAKGVALNIRVLNGEKLEILEDRGDWLKVVATNLKKRTGWLKREDIQFWTI